MGSFAERLASALGVALCLLAVALCRTPGWPRLLPPGQVPLDDVVVSPLLSFSGVSVVWMPDFWTGLQTFLSFPPITVSLVLGSRP